ncbi:MAG: glycosyltransferase family 4 protein [Bacteroidetes bacterium]|nr:glycosyltransferase family 4 protein [Bacteroidota bacterium]
MKVLIVLNGITHYFKLIVNQINNQPGVDISYVHPKSKSRAMGEGVFETVEGANFRLIELEEKVDIETSNLYYYGLENVLIDIKPDIILIGESHIKHLYFDRTLKQIISTQNIKIIMKSIPFRVESYYKRASEIKNEIKKLPRPPLNSIPTIGRQFFKLMKLDILYKNLFLDRKAFEQRATGLNLQKAIFNFPDAHVNYVEEAFKIYGSYGVPRNKIFITYNSPDTDFFFSIKAKIEKEPNIFPENKFRIIHLSRLVKWKRVDMLVSAIANLKSEFPQMELIIVGDGPEMGKLIKQAKDLNVFESIRFMGGVYDEEFFGKLIMSASLYVLAGMGGLSINDAMIFGLPVICSECDGTEKQLVKEGYNGLFFKSESQEELEEKIRYLFNNPELTKKMGENSVKIIKEKINIRIVVEGYMKAFNYVLNLKNND